MLLILFILGETVLGDAGALAFVDAAADARPFGLSGACNACRGSISSLNINPAGIADIKALRAGQITYMRNAFEEQALTASYFARTLPCPLAWQIYYKDLGEIQETIDSEGVAAYSGIKHYPRQAYILGAWADSSEELRWGAEGKIIFQQLINNSQGHMGLGWALDGGVLYKPTWMARTFFAAAFHNFGRQERASIEDGERVWMNGSLALGVQYQLRSFPKMNVFGEWEYTQNQGAMLKAAAEYWVSPHLVMRSGARRGWDEWMNAVKKLSGLKGRADKMEQWAWLSAGMGLLWHPYQLDYGVEFSDYVGAQHRLTLGRLF